MTELVTVWLGARRAPQICPICATRWAWFRGVCQRCWVTPARGRR